VAIAHTHSLESRLGAVSDIASLLTRLIAFPTQNPGGDEVALALHLGEALRARGADEVIVRETPRGNGEPGAWVYARYGQPTLLVNAHIDTVPVNAGWSGDPHRARRDGERLVGLGASDTKGAIAAILAALDERRPHDTGILFSGDEELGGKVARSFLAEGLVRGVTQAIVCEPTGLAVGTRHRGVLALQALRHGAGGHSSRADELPAPIAELARLAVAWHDWGKARRGEGPPGFLGTCLNIARLEGGVAFNVVPDTARLEISLRPAPGSDADAMIAELRALAARVVPQAVVEVDLANPPLLTHDAPAFARWLEAAETPIDLDFWTEAALFAAEGIDAVVYGPGRIAQAHAPDEWVELAELEGARQAFVRVFEETHRASGR
jgi:acetylornithine deacetylase